jgi:glycosyltransferase involved in cell wall biosynthesis
MPKVSVIIPNYNHAPFLRQRIDSVLNQSYQDFEVIILDDCSTDNSKELIEHYRSHVKVSQVIYNEQNSGSTFRQWIKGITEAKGSYIWIAESDDWCEPTFLENIIPNLLERPDCVIGYCQAYCVVGNDIKAVTTRPYLAEYIEGATFIKDYMVTTNSIYNASMAVWKKESFARISQDFTVYKLVGDWLFWVELCTTGNVFVSGRVLNYFRKHDKDVSGTAYGSGLNFIEEAKLLKALKDKQLISTASYKRQAGKIYFSYKRRAVNIDPQMRQQINAWFSENFSKGYLYKHHLALSVKYKGYQFLKKVIEKYR